MPLRALPSCLFSSQLLNLTLWHSKGNKGFTSAPDPAQITEVSSSGTKRLDPPKIEIPACPGLNKEPSLTMRTLHKVLAIIALLFLVTQIARIAYTRWIQPRPSGQDEISRVLRQDTIDPKLRTKIESARNLDDLIAIYEPLREKVDELSKAKQEDQKLNDAENVANGAITAWQTSFQQVA